MEYNYMIVYLVSILAITFSEEEVDGSVIQSGKRLSLRSVDPLARRSGGEDHFIRFGRSEEFSPGTSLHSRRLNLRKREAISSFDDKSSDYLKDENFETEKTTTPSSRSALCLPPNAGHQTPGQQLTCFITGKNSSGNTFYVVTKGEEHDDEENEEGDSDLDDEADRDFKQFVTNRTLSQLINSDVNRLTDMTRARRSKFSRNLFSRYDRGRDNFMRLGRSKIDLDDNENSDQIIDWNKRKHDSFMRLGRADESSQRGVRSNPENFIRLGRPFKNNSPRMSRKHDDFMRYGRGNEGYDRWSRKHDNFMRLGRSNDNDWWKNLYTDKRDKSANFMRLGRSSETVQPEEMETRLRRMDNFVRFGRDKSQDPMTKLPRKVTSFIRYGRSKPCDDETLKSVLQTYAGDHSSLNMAAVLTAAKDCFRKYSPILYNHEDEEGFPRSQRSRELILRFGKRSESVDSETNSSDSNDSYPVSAQFIPKSREYTPSSY